MSGKDQGVDPVVVSWALWEGLREAIYRVTHVESWPKLVRDIAALEPAAREAGLAGERRVPELSETYTALPMALVDRMVDYIDYQANEGCMEATRILDSMADPAEASRKRQEELIALRARADRAEREFQELARACAVLDAREGKVIMLPAGASVKLVTYPEGEGGAE